MSALPTEDARIFQTEWEVVSGKGMSVIKKKQFFACAIVEEGADGDCYAVEVFKEWAVDSRATLATAFERMKQIADHREEHNTWPPQNAEGEDPQ